MKMSGFRYSVEVHANAKWNSRASGDDLELLTKMFDTTMVPKNASVRLVDKSTSKVIACRGLDVTS